MLIGTIIVIIIIILLSLMNQMMQMVHHTMIMIMEPKKRTLGIQTILKSIPRKHIIRIMNKSTLLSMMTMVRNRTRQRR